MSDFVNTWTAAYQAPLSMGFSRQEYWSGVPLLSLILEARSMQLTHQHGHAPSGICRGESFLASS